MSLFNFKFGRHAQEFISPVMGHVVKGDIFVKNDKVPSVFIVDRLLDFSPAPMHVRLKEVGGNERTVTVALDILTDERFWHRQKTTENL